MSDSVEHAGSAAAPPSAASAGYAANQTPQNLCPKKNRQRIRNRPEA